VATPTILREVQPSQDHAVEVNRDEILQDAQEASRPLSGVVPVKKARKKARHRRALDEVGDEEPEVVDSPRIRKRPDYLRDFVCRNVNILSPIYEEPEVEENPRESECLWAKGIAPPDDPESTVVWSCWNVRRIVVG